MISNKKYLCLLLSLFLSSCRFYDSNNLSTMGSLNSKSGQTINSNSLVSKPSGNLDPNNLVAKPAGNLDPKKFVIVKNNGYANITLDEKGGYELHIVFSLTDFNIKSSSFIDVSEFMEIKLDIDGVEKIFSVEKELFKGQKTFSIFVNGVTQYSDIKVNVSLKDNKGNSVLEKEIIEKKVSENKSVSLKLSKPVPKVIVDNLPTKLENTDPVTNNNSSSSNSGSSTNLMPNPLPTPTPNITQVEPPNVSPTLAPTPLPTPTNIDNQTIVNYQFDKAIISNKDINMSGSPYIYSESSNTGNVHSNSNVNLSGYIDGDISYFGSINKSSNITINGETNQSNKINIPKFDTTKPSTNSSVSATDVFDIEPTNNQIVVKDQTISSSFSVKNNLFKGGGIKDIVLDNVVIDGDFDISGSNTIKVIIKNKVYVKGNFSIGGSTSIESGTSSGLLISDGDINISGSSLSPNIVNKILFISKSATNTSIQIKDSSNFYSIFYTENISSNIIITGSSKVYGSIISNGSVEVSSSTKIMRILNLQSIKNISE